MLNLSISWHCPAKLELADGKLCQTTKHLQEAVIGFEEVETMQITVWLIETRTRMDKDKNEMHSFV